MTEKRKLKDIIVLPDRIRTNKEQKSDMERLKDSIKKLGLFHPIVINERNELIAGFRRLTAFKQLALENPRDFDEIPVTVVTSLNEYKTLLAEIHENWVRKDFKGYELDVGLAKAKRLYQKLNPETVKGVNLKKGQRDEKGRIIDKTSIAVSPKLAKSAPRFEKKIAQEVGTQSVSTIGKRIRVGNAILDKKIPEEVVDQYKNKEIKHTKVLKTLETQRKLEKQLKESIKKEAKKIVEKPEPKKDRVGNIRKFKENLKSLIPKQYEFKMKADYKIRQKHSPMTVSQLRVFMEDIARNDKIWEEIGEPKEIKIIVRRLSQE